MNQGSGEDDSDLGIVKIILTAEDGIWRGEIPYGETEQLKGCSISPGEKY